MDRVKALLARVDRCIAETLAGAIEADLRDAGYVVTRREDDGVIVWAEPVAVTPAQAAMPTSESAAS